MPLVKQRPAGPWTVLGVLSMGFFMTLLDMTIVNIALPDLMSGTDASLDEGLWVFSAYILGYATLLIVAGRLGDLYGPRRIYLIGLVGFVLASCACGLATGPGMLIAARAVQGISGALLAPQLLPIVTMVFPPSKWGAAFGMTGALSGLAVLAGPTLGGVIVTYLDWRWIFYLNLPIGAACFFLVLRYVHDYRPGKRQPLALPSVGLLIAGLGAIAFALIEGERLDWSVTVWAVLVVGVGLVVAFVLDQRRRQNANPLLPFRLFRLRNFSAGNTVAAIMGFGMLGAFLPLSLYLQAVLGMSPLRAGFTIAAIPLVSAVAASMSGRVADRTGGKGLMVGGLGLFTAGMVLIALTTGTDTTTWELLGPFAVTGLGMGLIFAPLFSIAMRDVAPPEAGVASGLVNTSQEVGGLIATAAIGAALEARLAAGLTRWIDSEAQKLPEQARPGFRESFEGFSDSSLQVGGGPPAGSGEGAPDAEQAKAATDAFHDAFVSAMHVSLLLPIGLLLVGIVVAGVLIRRPVTPARPAGAAAARPKAAAPTDKKG